jgi:hypothetical protein
LLIRMKSQVQVLPSPLSLLTSSNAGRLVRSRLGEGVCRMKNALTWLPLLVMATYTALLS